MPAPARLIALYRVAALLALVLALAAVAAGLFTLMALPNNPHSQRTIVFLLLNVFAAVLWSREIAGMSEVTA